MRMTADSSVSGVGSGAGSGPRVNHHAAAPPPASSTSTRATMRPTFEPPPGAGSASVFWLGGLGKVPLNVGRRSRSEAADSAWVSPSSPTNGASASAMARAWGKRSPGSLAIAVPMMSRTPWGTAGGSSTSTSSTGLVTWASRIE